MRFLLDDESERDLSYKGGLLVIAAGLPRCATSSIQYALETQLDHKPCMHMAYVAPHADKLQICVAALQERDKAKRQKLLHQIFDGYKATADFPGMAFVDDLVEMYPDAKVILNQRQSAESWVRSITGTLQFFTSKKYLAMCYLWSTDRLHWKLLKVAKPFWNSRYGVKDLDQSIFVLENYERHNQWVRDVVAKNGNSLLEWQAEQGWEPICKFLGKPVPKEPFPRMNDENVIKLLIVVLVTRGLVSWGLLLSSPAILYWVWEKYLTS